jgi:hypothetical protein
MRRFIRDNALGLTFGLLFLLALGGQAVAGHADFNERQLAEGAGPVSFGSYVTSSDFAVDVTENWQSEYLQFFLFIFATAWLMQRGSPESKQADTLGRESDKEQQLGRHVTDESPTWARAGGWRTIMYSNSLGLLMLVVFLLAWLAQSIVGVDAYNSEQVAHSQETVSWLDYLASADFWNRTLQNWQSEFLAIGSMVVLSIYLRQRGSPESKPVGAPHTVTERSG